MANQTNPTGRAEITLVGLGPVGLATAWSLLRAGHRVHGFDRNRAVTEAIVSGVFPRAEGLPLGPYLKKNFFVHPTLAETPRAATTVVAVGTPATEHGFDLSAVAEAIEGTRAAAGRHLILRSTLQPGTVTKMILPLLAPEDEFSYFPEFLREQFLVEDTEHPPLSVAAHGSDAAAEKFFSLFPRVRRLDDYAAVETLKIASNAFHALKVAFANEVGDLALRHGTSAERLMEEFCRDTKLNLSDRYLKPGRAFSGACLDKDLRALEDSLDRAGLTSPLLRSVRVSNDLRKGER